MPQQSGTYESNKKKKKEGSGRVRSAYILSAFYCKRKENILIYDSF